MDRFKTMKNLAYCIFILFIFNGCFPKNNKFNKVCKENMKVGELIEVYGKLCSAKAIGARYFVEDKDNCYDIVVKNSEIDKLPMGSIIWAKGIVRVQKLVGTKGGQFPTQYQKYLEVKEFKLIKMGTGKY